MDKALIKVVKSKGWYLLPDNSNYKNRIQISGSSGNLYVVAQTKKNGIWSCGCLGFRRYRHCKHLEVMMPVLNQLTKKQLTRSKKTSKKKISSNEKNK